MLNKKQSQFQDEFPELAAGVEDAGQAGKREREEVKEPQYGPGPSLRPQSKPFTPCTI